MTHDSRLEELERKIRRLQKTAAAAIGAALLAVVLGTAGWTVAAGTAADFASVAANLFTARDTYNRTRIALDGNAGRLALFNTNAAKVVDFWHPSGAGQLVLGDAGGRARVQLDGNTGLFAMLNTNGVKVTDFWQPAGGAQLLMRDSGGRGRTVLDANTGRFSMLNTNGAKVIDFWQPSGAGQLVLGDASGKARIALNGAIGKIVFYDAYGKVAATIP